MHRRIRATPHRLATVPSRRGRRGRSGSSARTGRPAGDHDFEVRPRSRPRSSRWCRHRPTVRPPLRRRGRRPRRPTTVPCARHVRRLQPPESDQPLSRRCVEAAGHRVLAHLTAFVGEEPAHLDRTLGTGRVHADQADVETGEQRGGGGRRRARRRRRRAAGPSTRGRCRSTTMRRRRSRSGPTGPHVRPADPPRRVPSGSTAERRTPAGRRNGESGSARRRIPARCSPPRPARHPQRATQRTSPTSGARRRGARDRGRRCGPDSPPRRSVGGRRNVASDRLVHAVISNICSVVMPSASWTTATGFPENPPVAKTSTWLKRRCTRHSLPAHVHSSRTNRRGGSRPQAGGRGFCEAVVSSFSRRTNRRCLRGRSDPDRGGNPKPFASHRPGRRSVHRNRFDLATPSAHGDESPLATEPHQRRTVPCVNVVRDPDLGEGVDGAVDRRFVDAGRQLLCPCGQCRCVDRSTELEQGSQHGDPRLGDATPVGP